MINRILSFVLILLYCLIFFGAGFAIGQDTKLANKIMYNIRLVASSMISWEKDSSLDKNITVWTEDKSKRHDGLIMIGGFWINDPAVILVNSDGKVLHKWNVEKRIFNKEVLSKHRDYGKTDKEAVYGIEDAILLPDGSVIFSQSILELNNYRSQRVAKMDKDSNIIWQVPGLFHHDMILAEDGNIYTVGSEFQNSLPYIDRDKSKDSSYLSGKITVISPDGKVLNKISVEDAFANSKFKNLLSVFTLDIPVQETILKDDSDLYDPLHLNSVDYITAKQVEKMAFAKEGDLLISMRGNSTIAILRPSENKIVWAMRGSWSHQHHVNATDEGTIMIYDNDGGASIGKDSKGKVEFRQQPRVVEYDPMTNETKILFFNRSKEEMYSYWRGYYKKLDNGTMIVSSAETGRVLQVDDKGEIIWELRTIHDRKAAMVPYTKKVPSVKYYEKEYIKFLDCDNCADRR